METAAWTRSSGSAVVLLLMVLFQASALAQNGGTNKPPIVIPLAGQLQTARGDARSGTVLLVIALYADRDEPTPLWLEHQTTTLTDTGRYSISVGSTLDDGLPPYLFAGNGEARWLGLAVEGEPERPRVMVVAVPYVARAASADTLDGKSTAEFLSAADANAAVRAALTSPDLTEGVHRRDVGVTAATADGVPKWDSGLNLVETPIVSVGNKVGIGIAPAYELDVDGNVAFSNSLKAADSFGAAGSLTHQSGSFIVANNRDFLTLSANGRDDHLVVEFRQGRVGIGTTSPTDMLHIETVDNGRLKITRNGVSNVLLGDISGANDGGLLLHDGGGTRTVTLRAGGATVINGGSVGVGTTSPAATLHVAGNGRFEGGFTASSILAEYQDVAEWVDATEPLASGTVVVIDSATRNHVKASSTSYDTRVAGAVSQQPGIALGEPGPGRVLIAQSGRVRVKADARFGAIRPGDLLVTSPRAGYAMRSRPVRVGGIRMHRQGAVLGKALEALPGGSGEILVLLGLK